MPTQQPHATRGGNFKDPVLMISGELINGDGWVQCVITADMIRYTGIFIALNIH